MRIPGLCRASPPTSIVSSTTASNSAVLKKIEAQEGEESLTEPLPMVHATLSLFPASRR